MLRPPFRAYCTHECREHAFTQPSGSCTRIRTRLHARKVRLVNVPQHRVRHSATAQMCDESNRTGISCMQIPFTYNNIPYIEYRCAHIVDTKPIFVRIWCLSHSLARMIHSLDSGRRVSVALIYAPMHPKTRTQIYRPIIQIIHSAKFDDGKSGGDRKLNQV